MAPKEKVISPFTKKEYELNNKNAPILICDLLGFKNLVLERDIDELKLTMLYLIEDLHFINIRDFGLDLFKGNKQFYDRISEFWPENYPLQGTIVSDTIFMYPLEDIAEGPLSYELSVLLLSVASTLLFQRVLESYHFLLRGSICYGEYCIIDNPRLIFGKAVIDAYNLESIQNWGGILLSPAICENLRDSHILNSIYTEYLDLPIKEREQEAFESLCLAHISFPHALNWPRLVYSVDWDPIYSRLDNIEDSDEKRSAKEKIDNTKKFHELMISRIRS